MERKTLPFKLILLIFGLILGLILSEILLATQNLPRFYEAHSAPYQFSIKFYDDGKMYYTNYESDEIEFIYDGNLRGYFDDNNAVIHTTNSDGFRGEEFIKEKAAGITRIAFIGDSFTFGEGVKDEDIFATKVSQKLDEKYQVYNFGVGGFNTKQSVDLLENVVLDFQPDIVVYSYTLNDAEEELFYINYENLTIERRPREMKIHEGLSDQKPPDNLFYKPRITKMLWQTLNNMRLTNQTEAYYNSLYAENKRHWTETKESIAKLENICTEKQLDCYFVIFPLLFKLDETYPFHPLHEKVLEHVNLPVVDVFPALEKYDAFELWVHPTDQHPNEVVHEVASELIVKAIKDQ